MKAVWMNAVIAQSDDIVEVEGNAYFPLSSLDRSHVADSATRTSCPWKGQAHYFNVKSGDRVNPDAAWYYPAPKAGAEAVAGRVAFWRGVKVMP